MRGIVNNEKKPGFMDNSIRRNSNTYRNASETE